MRKSTRIGLGKLLSVALASLGAVQAVQAETGISARGIDVSGSVEDKTITFTVSKDVIGDDVSNYRYIIVIGSQDGFGTGKWRDVDATPKTWRLGGGVDPADDDGIDYDPNIVDIILEGDGQQAMLYPTMLLDTFMPKLPALKCRLLRSKFMVSNMSVALLIQQFLNGQRRRLPQATLRAILPAKQPQRSIKPGAANH